MVEQGTVDPRTGPKKGIFVLNMEIMKYMNEAKKHSLPFSHEFQHPVLNFVPSALALCTKNTHKHTHSLPHSEKSGDVYLYTENKFYI